VKLLYFLTAADGALRLTWPLNAETVYRSLQLPESDPVLAVLDL
jgi:hypothetical protein